MSQYPGGDPNQQAWGTPPTDPRATPGQGQAYQPGQGQPTYPAQPGYSQPGYAQQPGYAAPTGQPGYPGSGYPAQTGYPTQPTPAPQPNYGYQPQAYAAAPYRPAPADNGPKSPVLGFIAVAVVALATVGSLAAGWVMLQELQRYLADAVYTGTPSSDEIEQAIVGPITGIGIAATTGFAGWVAGIVAAATNRGRVAGIIAIVAGLIAPFLIGGYLAMAFASLVQQYQ
jgi:hypothetical protein